MSKLRKRNLDDLLEATETHVHVRLVRLSRSIRYALVPAEMSGVRICERRDVLDFARHAVRARKLAIALRELMFTREVGNG